jgi:hypothetical protein
VASVIVTTSRSIATHDILAIDLGLNRDVLSDWEPENIIRMTKRETVAE